MQVKKCFKERERKVVPKPKNCHLWKMPQEMTDWCYQWKTYYRNLSINCQEVDSSIFERIVSPLKIYAAYMFILIYLSMIILIKWFCI